MILEPSSKGKIKSKGTLKRSIRSSGIKSSTWNINYWTLLSIKPSTELLLLRPIRSCSKCIRLSWTIPFIPATRRKHKRKHPIQDYQRSRMKVPKGIPNNSILMVQSKQTSRISTQNHCPKQSKLKRPLVTTCETKLRRQIWSVNCNR